MPETNVKGVFIAHVREFIVERHGEAGLEAVMKALSPGAAKTLSVAAGFEWYPLTQCVEIEHAVCNSLYGGDIGQARALGNYDIKESISKVYRFLFKVLEPSFIIARSGRLWSTFYDAGHVRLERPEPKRVILTLEDFDTLAPVHCNEIHGAFVGLLELCNLPAGTVTHPECRHTGAKACVYHLSW